MDEPRALVSWKFWFQEYLSRIWIHPPAVIGYFGRTIHGRPVNGIVVLVRRLYMLHLERLSDSV